MGGVMVVQLRHRISAISHVEDFDSHNITRLVFAGLVEQPS